MEELDEYSNNPSVVVKLHHLALMPGWGNRNDSRN